MLAAVGLDASNAGPPQPGYSMLNDQDEDTISWSPSRTLRLRSQLLMGQISTVGYLEHPSQGAQMGTPAREYLRQPQPPWTRRRLSGTMAHRPSPVAHHRARDVWMLALHGGIPALFGLAIAAMSAHFLKDITARFTVAAVVVACWSLVVGAKAMLVTREIQ